RCRLRAFIGAEAELVRRVEMTTRRNCMILAMAALAAPANAANVNLTANLVNSCILTLGTTGIMTPNSSGTQISSEESGGTAATLTLVAIGSVPTLSFSAPSLTTSPAGWGASPTVEVKYSSLGGANQGYTSNASSASLAALTDSFTINGRVSSSTGF